MLMDEDISFLEHRDFMPPQRQLLTIMLDNHYFIYLFLYYLELIINLRIHYPDS
jgi:hypothetical protein